MSTFDLTQQVRIINPSSNVDALYGYYDSVSDACEAIATILRRGGRTVGIKQLDGTIIEYWWENDTDLTDGGLVPKTSGLQDIDSEKLLGRYSTGVGPVQEITLGGNLTLSEVGVLNSVNTTYTQITNNELTTGTSTDNRIVSAKVLADWLNPLLSSKADDNTVVKLTGNQSIDGIKTFTALPESSAAPTTANQFTNKAYVDGLIADGLRVPDPIDCSGDPDYPESDKGDTYQVTVAGKIGGASGPLVEVGDMIVCTTANAGGTHATVGSDFYILQSNIDKATTAVHGTVRLATPAEISTGTSSDAITTVENVSTLIGNNQLIGSTSITIDSGTKEIRRAALIGDVTSDANSNTTTIADNVVTHAKYQDIGTQTILGRSTSGSGNVEELTLGGGLTLTEGVLSTTAAYTEMSLLELETGTETDVRVISAKTLNDWAAWGSTEW